MNNRSYTVAEIDALREACDNKYLWGSFNNRVSSNGSSMSRSYTEVDKAKVVEEMVRTYMLAGKTAEELRASER